MAENRVLLPRTDTAVLAGRTTQFVQGLKLWAWPGKDRIKKQLIASMAMLQACRASRLCCRPAISKLPLLLGARGLCVRPFPSTPLPYRGVMILVDDSLVPSFAERLGESVAQWRREGLNSAMLRVPIHHAALAAVAATHGFVYHHAEGDSAVLKCWLNGQKPDKLPPFASHRTRAAPSGSAH
jgi:hypothetical protein